MSRRNLILVLCMWLGLTFVFAGVGIYKLDLFEYRRIANSRAPVQGKVVAKEPENHRFIRYSYTVGQKEYMGLGNAGGVNPEFEQLKVGDTVTIYYDPQAPQESFLGDPSEQSNSLTRGVLFITLLGPLFTMIGLYKKGWLPVKPPRKLEQPE